MRDYGSQPKDIYHLVDCAAHILTKCVHIGQRLVSGNAWAPVADVVNLSQGRDTGGEAVAVQSKPSKKALVAEHPWLQGFLEVDHKRSKEQMHGARSKCPVLPTKKGEPSDTEDEPTDDESLFELLGKKRAELVRGAPPNQFGFLRFPSGRKLDPTALVGSV